MYDLQYVRKRRRRKIAALVSLFAAIGITSLVIVSFLGRTVGSFSVKLTNSNVRLSLSENADFNPTRSYLELDTIYPLTEETFSNLHEGIGNSIEALDVDNETLSTTNGAIVVERDNGKRELRFVKYTFFIRNFGDTIARYNLNIKISDIKVSTDGTKRYLDDTLRVMVFENDIKEDTHNYRVFAKESHKANYDSEGNRVKREFVAEYPDDSTEPKEGEEGYGKYVLAETFINESIAAKYEVGNFANGDVKRYTIVAWLEGFDPDAENEKDPPEGASLKLGVDIAAYENV